MRSRAFYRSHARTWRRGPSRLQTLQIGCMRPASSCTTGCECWRRCGCTAGSLAIDTNAPARPHLNLGRRGAHRLACHGRADQIAGRVIPLRARPPWPHARHGRGPPFFSFAGARASSRAKCPCQHPGHGPSGKKRDAARGCVVIAQASRPSASPPVHRPCQTWSHRQLAAGPMVKLESLSEDHVARNKSEAKFLGSPNEIERRTRAACGIKPPRSIPHYARVAIIRCNGAALAAPLIGAGNSEGKCWLKRIGRGFRTCR
jgi:hypothetical protein